MSIKTKIQWCDSTANPTMGCDGCELWTPDYKACYAGVLTERYDGKTAGYPKEFNKPTKYAGRMAKAAKWSDLTGKPRRDKPWLDGMPRMIFVSDMGDALSKDIDFGYLYEQVVQVCQSPNGLRHLWLWLTKRPGRMAEFCQWLQDEKNTPWPDHIWPGTSVIRQDNVRKLQHLEQVGGPRTTRFISIEPQWEAVDLRLNEHPGIDWVIQGGQSGKDAKPFEYGWALDVQRQCRDHKRYYFLKQVGEQFYTIDLTIGGRKIEMADRHGGNWEEWGKSLRHRHVPPPIKAAPESSAEKEAA